jgi:hypothetical protein
LTLRTRRLAWGVRVHADGWVALDDAFFVEPALPRRVTLAPRGGDPAAAVTITALNVEGSVAAGSAR